MSIIFQGQSSDPPAEGPEAAFPWLWTPHSLDPGPTGKKTCGQANTNTGIHLV